VHNVLVIATKSLFAGALLVLCLSSKSLPAQAPDVQEIVRRSVESSRKDWKNVGEYDYFERELDEGKSKTYDVVMMLGSRYRRLTAINDQPLSPELAAREETLMRKARSDREHESPAQRQERVAHYKKETDQQQLFLEELPKAFDFTLAGEETLDSRAVYVVKAKPRRGYHPPNTRAKALTGMEGTLWIDATDFRWARVQAEVKHAVSIEGFFARVEPGTRFLLEQRPVEGGAWLPTHFSMHTRAKVLLLFPHNEQDESSYYGYHKSK